MLVLKMVKPWKPYGQMLLELEEVTQMPDTLIGKWKRAIIESRQQMRPSKGFNKGATEAERKDWQKEAEEAHRQRELNESSESMDIFNAEEALLPTLKETAHHMILAEGKASARGDVQAVSSPDASWLSEGILIEHRRLEVAHCARKLGPNPSDKAKLNLAQKRQRLQSDLKDFNLKGFSHYNLEGYQILESLPGVSSLGEAWDDDEEEIAQDELLGQQEIPNHSNLTTISEEPWNPEKQPAAMPSTLGLRNEHGSWIWSFSGGIEERASFVQSNGKRSSLYAYGQAATWEKLAENAHRDFVQKCPHYQL
ncbi:uncharacterized protein BXZ73DRAFT_82698 [Epithele typhae]|uniref:uncharacterized protein n=1 Tax=Epithele typhae TaxID=378194 RepID=UPI002008C6CC|nr:uncharacterized protein BXZ73DRAFT_82698 [Epithele typhae]KAH9911561.1 hypothetical protein BXZ73DRAFT_82698 [Epithele typhae]